MRLQAVDLDNDAPNPLRDGEALTLRLAGQAEFALEPRTTALFELEGVVALNDGFNDGRGRRPNRPFIPDPEGLEINRAQISTERWDGTRITLGRQRIALDDWRFIGEFPFRQNHQSIDALRIETRRLGPGSLDAGYFNRVQRPLGRDNPGGRFEGDSVFANYTLSSPIGRVTAFHYRFDIETGPQGVLRHVFSNRVTGARLFGRRQSGDLGVSWEASYAHQTDHDDNPIDYAADYGMGEIKLETLRGALTFRAERLGADNGQGFQTPLASLHKFQGLADQFLRTPGDGVDDLSVAASAELGDLGVLRDVRVLARHHWFSAAETSQDYGRELDLTLGAKIGDVGLSLEFADYSARGFATDKQVISISTAIGF